MIKPRSIIVAAVCISGIVLAVLICCVPPPVNVFQDPFGDQTISKAQAPVGTPCGEFGVACFDELARQPANIICFHPQSRWSRTLLTWCLAHALEHTALHLGHMQIMRQLWRQRES